MEMIPEWIMTRLKNLNEALRISRAKQHAAREMQATWRLKEEELLGGIRELEHFRKCMQEDESEPTATEQGESE